MRKLLLTLMACIVAIAANAWSVKFTNPDNWSTVYVYVFGTNAAGPASSWPGATMTKSGDVWTYEYSGSAPANIIFNAGNGQPQTADLTFGSANDGKTFDKNGPVGAQLNDYSVYFDNSTAKWDNVYAYCWDGISTAGWPGNKITTTDSRGYYVFEYKAVDAPSSNAKIIWNNGSGTQTSNLNYVPGEVYDQNGPVSAKEETYTVYLNNTAGWDKVFVYTFNPELAGTWPGTEISKNAEGLYVWNYTSKVKPECEGIIFNNGGNGAQTGDLTYVVGETYTNGEGAAEVWVNLNGSFHPEGENGVQPVDGIASWTNQAIGSYPVYVKIWDGADNYYQSATPVEVGVWTALNKVDTDNNPTYIKGATDNCVFDVQYNVTTNEIKFELVSGDLTETPIIPEVVYIKGAYDDWTGTYTLTLKEGTTDKGEYVYAGSIESLDGEFKVAQYQGDNWSGLNYGASGEGNRTLSTGGDTLEAWRESLDNFIADNLNNVTIFFYYNPELGAPSWIQAVGDTTDVIENVIVEEALTVYNVNGVKVLNNGAKSDLKALTPGLYIVNGKKLIVK